MTKLATYFLAASALIPASLAAQTVTPPVPWQDVPAARLNVPGSPRPAMPAPGISWRQRAPAPVAPRIERRMPPPSVVAPQAAMRHGRDRVIVRHDRDRIEHRRGHRFVRGTMVPPFWFGPQFHVQNWGLYGFPPPGGDRRWVRYYDDAYLIDRDGRVHDGRYGLDWDEYGERWDDDGRGIPAYVGDGDFHPGDEDYAYVEGYDGEAYADDYHDDRYRDEEVYAGDYRPQEHRQGYGHPMPTVSYGGCQQAYSCSPPPPPCGHCGYGYGWGVMTVTETTVTTPGTVTTHTYYVDEPVAAPAKRVIKRKYRKAKPRIRGERG